MATKRNETEIIGTVKKIVFFDRDAGDGEPSAIILALRDGSNVKGMCREGDIETGLAYRFLGQWREHPRYGDQFHFDTFTADEKLDRAGVVRYLELHAENVGKSRANALFDAFGDDAVRVLREDPTRAVIRSILTPDQAREASRSLGAVANHERTKIDLYTLFARRGFPGKLIGACIEKWGARAVEKIRRDPFILMTNDLPGCGWSRTDKLYLDLSKNPDARKRRALAVWDALDSGGRGHTWQRLGEIEPEVRKRIARPFELLPVVEFGVRARMFATRRGKHNLLWVAEAKKAEHERIVAECVRRLQEPAPRWPAPSELSAKLSDHQRSTLGMTMGKPVGVLAGSPGTGKTTAAAAAIFWALVTLGRSKVAVCAPTGKAAVRMTDSMRRNDIRDIEATTIHRLLGVSRNGRDRKGWGFQFNKHNPLPHEVVFVDEVSMCDCDIMAALLCALQPGAHLMLIGDIHQLPPVGHGAPLRDLRDSGIVPVGELTEIRRNSGRIVQACARIKDGKRIEPTPGGTAFAVADIDAGENLFLVPVETPEAALQALDAQLARVRSLSLDPVWDCQVLTPTNEKSLLARLALNDLLQGKLNPPGARNAPPTFFRLNDKVICTKNDWRVEYGRVLGHPEYPEGYRPLQDPNWKEKECFVANGEIGRVCALDERHAIVELPHPTRFIRISAGKSGAASGMVDDFTLAYAITAHRSQGSEWPAVVVMIDEHGSMVASREWHYTAISRAQRVCILVGKATTIEKQCRAIRLRYRQTHLVALLRGEQPEATPVVSEQGPSEGVPSEALAPGGLTLNLEMSSCLGDISAAVASGPAGATEPEWWADI